MNNTLLFWVAILGTLGIGAFLGTYISSAWI